ncbi:MAG: RDD family protein [Caldilineaceae bacterium]|nr:RDD family protein [Caldilineaceae bacterium]
MKQQQRSGRTSRKPGGSPTADYAGLKRRLTAFAYDYILIAIYIGILASIGIAVYLNYGIVEPLFGNPVSSDVSAFVLLILPVILYFTWQEGSTRASTWGKRRVGLRVSAADGRPIGYGQAFMRSLLKLLPWQIGHTAVFQLINAGDAVPLWVYLLFVAAYGLAIVYLVALWRRPDHRTPYDVIAGTAVIQPIDAPPSPDTNHPSERKR